MRYSHSQSTHQERQVPIAFSVNASPTSCGYYHQGSCSDRVDFFGLACSDWVVAYANKVAFKMGFAFQRSREVQIGISSSQCACSTIRPPTPDLGCYIPPFPLSAPHPLALTNPLPQTPPLLTPSSTPSPLTSPSPITLIGPLLTIKLITSNNVSAAAMVVCSALVS